MEGLVLTQLWPRDLVEGLKMDGATCKTSLLQLSNPHAQDKATTEVYSARGNGRAGYTSTDRLTIPLRFSSPFYKTHTSVMPLQCTGRRLERW